MIEPLDQLQTTLREHSLSTTKPRRIIFAALQEHEPQTMAELIAACHEVVDRASVYRTIRLFEQLGVIQRLHIGWKYKLELSASFSYHHHHLTCQACSKIVVLPEDILIEKQVLALAQTQGFLPTDHQLEIHGLCAGCQKT